MIFCSKPQTGVFVTLDTVDLFGALANVPHPDFVALRRSPEKALYGLQEPGARSPTHRNSWLLASACEGESPQLNICQEHVRPRNSLRKDLYTSNSGELRQQMNQPSKAGRIGHCVEHH